MEALEAEFPSWRFAEVWHTAASGPDGRTLTAWRAGVTLSSATVAGLRRAVREAGG